ncbi:MAG: hypothetical protein KAG56_02605 [Sulfurovaceae bacterium]|nr:hypothetical protein [Sulfurovaceae bacterium]
MSGLEQLHLTRSKVLKGIGQPYHDYQKNWEEDKVKPIENMEIKIISTKESVVDNQK